MTKPTTILIDCTNTYSGGAKTHLRELASRAPYTASNSVCTFVGAREILDILPQADRNILKRTHALLNRGALARHFWRMFYLPKLVREFDIAFYPGGTVIGSPKKSVTMSRNMLPLMREEYSRYGLSKYYLKLELLRILQRRSFRRASGIIFLSEYAREMVLKDLGEANGNDKHYRLIPHGIADEFRQLPKPHSDRFPASDNTLSLLYVSSFDVYKNQETVLLAAKKIREGGRDIRVTFIGPQNPVAYKRFSKLRNQVDRFANWTHVKSEISQQELCAYYVASDMFVYASTCENLPNILLEAMAARIPIVCSDSRPMSDVLGDGGLYFEPRNPKSLQSAIEKVASSPDLRSELTAAAFERAAEFDWDKCARETFGFLEEACSGH